MVYCPGNVAVHKIAEQSSQYEVYNTPEKAVDGEAMFSHVHNCTHTGKDRAPWWKVDLDSKHVIYSVKIYNRICPGCEDRLRNFTVTVGKIPWVPDPKDKLCALQKDAVADGGVIDLTCKKPLIGRYVKIQINERLDYLALCEVQVQGYPFITRVTDLAVDSRYYFRIRLQRKEGRDGEAKIGASGPMGGPFRTKCTAPSIGPKITDIRTAPLGLSLWPSRASVTLSWQAVPLNSMNCLDMKGYKVYYVQQGEWKSIKNLFSQPPATVSNLYAHSLYKMKVAVLNSDDMETSGSPVSILTADGRPGRVRDVEVNHGPNLISISWLPPASNESFGDIEQYQIKHRLEKILACDYETTDTAISIRTHQLNSIIKNLKPYRKYQIIITAETSAGQGLETVQQVITTPSVPTGVPIQPIVNRVTETSAHVQWVEFACENRNGPGLLYHYEYTSQHDYRTIELRTRSTSIELEDLIPFTNYSLRYRFETDVGYGKFSAETMFSTIEAAPPAPIAYLASVDYNSLTVAWSAPFPPNGILTSYTVLCWEENLGKAAAMKKIILNPAMTRIVFDHLLTATDYLCVVQATTRAGAGPFSGLIKANTVESVPDAPAEIILAERTTSSLTITWKDPKMMNGQLNRFKVTCTPQQTYDLDARMNPSKYVRSQVVMSDIHHHQFSNLLSGTSYECRVEARTRKGYGPPKSIVAFTRPAKPDVNIAPSIDFTQSTDTTLTLKLSPVQLSTGPVSAYQIGIIKSTSAAGSRSRRSVNRLDDSTIDKLTNYNAAQREGLGYYIAAELYDLPPQFVLGDNKTYNGYYNAPLDTGAEIDVLFGVISTVNGESQATYVSYGQPVKVQRYVKGSESKGSNMATYIGIVFGVLIVLSIIIVVALFLLRMKRQKMKKELEKDDLKKPPTMDELCMSKSNNRISTISTYSFSNNFAAAVPLMKTEREDEDEMTEQDIETKLDSPIPQEELYVNIDVGIPSHTVTPDSLLDYIRERKADRNAGFYAEYREFPDNFIAAHDVAMLHENRNKNRFRNIVAYDHSRVVLELTDADPYSHYINANYIIGFEKPKAYIAAQGPSKNTIPDMWRMIWQEDASKIIMLTNLVELAKVKCEQYWPDEGMEVYGDITVEILEIERIPYMVTRKFRLSKGDKQKTIKHFHFIGWPDHGVPLFPSTMLCFRNKVNSYKGKGSGPIIIHCSAGVGRTGTYIGIDYLLQQCAKEDQMDVYNCVHLMRSQRVKMVQTLDQYIFIHDALLEALKVGQTTFPCQVFKEKYSKMNTLNRKTNTTKLMEQFELLTAFDIHPDPDRCRGALHHENRNKNRCIDILPEEKNRPLLSTPVQGRNSYINAVFVKGYSKWDQFLVTQTPMATTGVDFWRMMFDYHSNTIVMMQQLQKDDETCAKYWPSCDGNYEFGPLVVEAGDTNTDFPNITIRDFRITNRNKLKDGPRLIRQFQLNVWHNGDPVPQSEATILTLIDMVDRWLQQTGAGPVTVHCMNGAYCGGLFCAAVAALDKVKLDHEVDIFQTTRLVRISRPQLVSNFEQYKFIHDVVIEYLNNFDTYSNFK
ncbi:receptor-type tyrosine-protein phosphatase kappa-like [Tubulanus polymorphus]|uniref:receptor-type tyrosine-protein phosphatase kappa-like n=1 Tax=Tubulanus polymorphus TaxID=672921 RepID=UPI003DA47231